MHSISKKNKSWLVSFFNFSNSLTPGIYCTGEGVFASWIVVSFHSVVTPDYYLQPYLLKHQLRSAAFGHYPQGFSSIDVMQE